jgi:hypothetical protein
LIHAQFGLFTVPESNPAVWILLFLATDFVFYWSHRASHRVNFFAAAHAVHHQAVDFNHASALRQSWTNRPVMFLFYIPFAVAGVSLAMISGVLLVNLLLQFFSHNGVIRRKLGWLEYVFVTPRTHRVHHGVNAPYLDKNFGGVLIVWDRLFGSFVDLDEKKEVRIGWEDAMNRFDPIAANFDFYQKILFVSRRRTGFWKRLSTWIETPEALGAELERLGFAQYRPLPKRRRFTNGAKLAVLAVLAVAVTATVYLLRHAPSLPLSNRVSIAVLVFFVIWCVGRILTRDRVDWRRRNFEDRRAA